MEEPSEQELARKVGRKLQARRRALGMSQSKLAAACGVTFQQIAKYESGENAILAARLWRIAEVLEVPLAWFYEP